MSNIDKLGIIEMSDQDMESLAGGYGYKKPNHKLKRPDPDPCCDPCCDPCPPDPCCDPCPPKHFGWYPGVVNIIF